MTIDPDDVRNQAQIDQFRAQASQFLDQHIEAYREMTANDGGSDSCAFSTSVATTVAFIDPDDALPDQQSNQLTFVAEVLANAISRLAQR